MKARVKASGEVFEIASYARIPMECCDSYGNPLSFSFDEVEILSEGNDLKESEAPDYWTRLKHTYAGMAMQEIIARHNVDFDTVVEWSADLAHALVEKLKRLEERK